MNEIETLECGNKIIIQNLILPVKAVVCASFEELLLLLLSDEDEPSDYQKEMMMSEKMVDDKMCEKIVRCQR